MGQSVPTRLHSASIILNAFAMLSLIMEPCKSKNTSFSDLMNLVCLITLHAYILVCPWGNTWKSESVAIISLDAALTLQSASQTTVNNLTAKLKYVDTVMKGDNLLSDNLTLNNSQCQIIYAQQKWVGIESISLNGMSSVVYWKKNQRTEK